MSIKEYGKYISVFPGIIYLGKCYYKTQDYTKVEEIFLKIKEIFPADSAIRYWLGIIYEKTGHIDKAAREFEKLA